MNNKIRNEKGEKEKKEISIDTAEIQKIIREYYEQLYTNKCDKLEEMDNFPETRSLPKLNQREIDNLNKLITRNEIEYGIIIITKKKKKKTSLQTKGQNQEGRKEGRISKFKEKR